MEHRPVAVIVRGRGRGHAVRADLVLTALSRAHPEIPVAVASYATGAQVLAERGREVTDLCLPPEGAHHDRLAAMGRFLLHARPAALLVDEDLWALPLGRMLAIPAVFVTNWLAGADLEPNIEFLQAASSIVVADHEDSFLVPRWLTPPVSFVGPICRRFATTASSTLRAREAFGVPPACSVVAVTVSGDHACDADFLRVCLSALGQLGDRLVAVVEAGAMFDRYAHLRSGYAPNIVCLSRVPDVADLYAASDLVITRGGHTTLWELARMGAAALCVPYARHVDPLHESYARRMQGRGTLALVPESHLSPGYLAAAVEELLGDERRRRAMAEAGRRAAAGDGADRVAAIVAQVWSEMSSVDEGGG